MNRDKSYSNTEIGKHIEEYACRYLKSHDYEIIETNWRYKKAEIDIIAKYDELIVFVEVKSRSSTYFGEPETAINDKKEQLLLFAAQRYLENISFDWAIRFDIISIQMDLFKRPILLKHIKDVFF